MHGLYVHYNFALTNKKVKQFSLCPIKVSGKTGIPRDILGKGLTESALKKLDRQNAKDRANSGNIGNSCETDEGKK